jgi:hypothetical protein
MSCESYSLIYVTYNQRRIFQVPAGDDFADNVVFEEGCGFATEWLVPWGTNHERRQYPTLAVPSTSGESKKGGR